MLFVEQEVAAPIGGRDLVRGLSGRASAEVHDLNARGEENSPATGSKRGAEVDGLFVHEISLVQESGGDGVGPTHHQTCARHPVWRALDPRHSFDHPRNEADTSIVAADEQLLFELAKGAEHRTKR